MTKYKITSKGLTITAGTIITIAVIIFGAGKFVGTTKTQFISIEEKIDHVAIDVKSNSTKLDILLYDKIDEDGNLIAKKESK